MAQKRGPSIVTRERAREGGRRNKTYKGRRNGKQEEKKHTHDPDDKIEQIKTYHQRMREGGRRRSRGARAEGDKRGEVRKERKGRIRRRGSEDQRKDEVWRDNGR